MTPWHSRQRFKRYTATVRLFVPVVLLRARSAASVAPPAMVVRLSDMRWTPLPRSCAFLALRVRELTPIQPISEDSRPYSIFGQRFITTLRPAASASAAASSLRTPSCIQITCGRGLSASASSTIGQRVLRGAEDVDHVDRLGDVGEPGVDLLPEHFLAGLAGIDRDHAVAALEQILEGEIARPVVLRRDADHGDRLHGVENAADVAVG